MNLKAIPPPWRSSLAPVFQQQSSKDTGSVLRPDLVRHNHSLYHKVCDAWQSGLLQVEKGSPWENRQGRDLIPIRYRNTPRPSQWPCSPKGRQVCWVSIASHVPRQIHSSTWDGKREHRVRARPLLAQKGVICRLFAWTDTYCAPGIEPGPQAQPWPSEYGCADPTFPRGSQASPGPRASSQELGSLAPAELCSAPTMGYGPPEFQQASEGERGHVGLPPALRLFLHILLKLDPAGRLPPVGLLAAIQHQLVQLHKHLGWGAQGEGLGGHQVGPAVLGMWVMGQAGREGGRRWEERREEPKGPSPQG